MRLAPIKPGDMVRADVGGRRFHGVVEQGQDATKRITVRPIERGITFRTLTARQVVAHFIKTKGSE